MSYDYMTKRDVWKPFGEIMKPVVTIGICLHNNEKTVSFAIDSLLKQNFEHDKMQIIFVDDGSEDNTLSIVKKFILKTDIDTKIFKTKWRGIGSARNTAVNNADGDFILWLDADEILTKDYIKKQIEFMEQNTNVGITAGVFSIVQNNFVLNLELIPWIVNHFQYQKPRNAIWKTTKIIGTGGSTFRVIALEQVNGFDERLKGAGEDQDIAQRIVNAGWLIKLNNAYFYELHGGMSTFKDLWKKYVWYGHGCELIYRRNRAIFSLFRMSPLAGLLTGFLYLPIAYLLFHQKQIFLLPIHYAIKMTAWMVGFIANQFGHS